RDTVDWNRSNTTPKSFAVMPSCGWLPFPVFLATSYPSKPVRRPWGACRIFMFVQRFLAYYARGFTSDIARPDHETLLGDRRKLCRYQVRPHAGRRPGTEIRSFPDL